MNTDTEGICILHYEPDKLLRFLFNPFIAQSMNRPIENVWEGGGGIFPRSCKYCGNISDWPGSAGCGVKPANWLRLSQSQPLKPRGSFHDPRENEIL